MSHHRTCCCSVCNPDQFGCDYLTGSASWSFDYRYNYARTLSGTWYDCYELSSQSPNCSDPDAEGPYLWAYQQGEWSGYLHRDGTLSSTVKGNLWKGPFHLPRMQLYAWKLLEEMAGATS